MKMKTTWLAALSLVASGAGCAPEDTSTSQHGLHFRYAAYSVQKPPSSNADCGRDCPPGEVAGVNLTTTVCADGTEAATCPVEALDWSAFDSVARRTLEAVVQQGTLPVLVSGELVASKRGRLRGSPTLAASLAWAGVMSDPIDGLVFSIEGASLSCGTRCELRAELLNWPDTVELAGLDLSRLALGALARAAAEAAAADGLLLVEGRVGPDLVLSATQLLLPVAVADTALNEP